MTATGTTMNTAAGAAARGSHRWGVLEVRSSATDAMSAVEQRQRRQAKEGDCRIRNGEDRIRVCVMRHRWGTAVCNTIGYQSLLHVLPPPGHVLTRIKEF